MTQPPIYNSPNSDYTPECEEQSNSTQRQVVATIDKFMPSDVDDASSPKYYGYVDSEGNWYILRSRTSGRELRYHAGTDEYPANWTNRANLEYDYWYNRFNPVDAGELIDGGNAAASGATLYDGGTASGSGVTIIDGGNA